MIRVALYGRVSTSDGDRDPETQPVPLREFVVAQKWTTAAEFVDRASAADLRGRTPWKELLSLAPQLRIEMIAVWRLDRAFRSVVHFVNTVEDLRRWGVAFRSYSEAMVDTSGNSPIADLVMTVLAAVAQFERALISERVRSGMDRARKQGRHVGRPWALNGDLDVLRPAIEAGTLSRRQAAKRLGVTVSTISRALSRKGSPSEPPGGRVNADVSSAQ